MDISRILASTPDYQEFKTVDELNNSSEKLLKQYPQKVEKKVIGKSKKGENIEVLRIGQGSFKALLFGCPHPNEPIGSMMLEHLSELLCQGLSERLDCSWYLIKCIDPDGTRLNEGWFKGPHTVKNYAKNFYRPPGYEQPEWTFPISYKTLEFSSPIPETRSLMNIIKEVKPDFMYSLHNAGFGGTYYYITDPIKELYQPFKELASERGLPLSLGEPEMPYAEKFDEAIYKMVSTKDSYDYFAEHTESNPAEIIPAGTSSFDYLKNIKKDSFAMVCEMPYFYDDKISDTSPGSISRKEAVIKSADIYDKARNFLADFLSHNHNLIKQDSPFKRALTEFISTAEKQVQAKKSWAASNKDLHTKATVAQEFDNLVITRFYTLLVIGMAERLINAELENATKNSDKEKLKQSQNRVSNFFTSWHQKLAEKVDYQVIPIKKLVEVQLGSALHAINAII